MKLDDLGNESLSAINHNENRGEMNGHVLSANIPSPGKMGGEEDPSKFPLPNLYKKERVLFRSGAERGKVLLS